MPDLDDTGHVFNRHISNVRWNATRYLAAPSLLLPMETSDIDPQYVGLLPQHKERLEHFADRYCAAATRGARREVAQLAADDVVKEFKITGKEEIALTNQASFHSDCYSFLKILNYAPCTSE